MGEESRLTAARLAYLKAVAASCEPYEARHGGAANWALRHKYVDSVIRLSDGREGFYSSFSVESRCSTGIDAFLGQRITPLGSRLLEDPNNG